MKLRTLSNVERTLIKTPSVPLTQNFSILSSGAGLTIVVLIVHTKSLRPVPFPSSSYCNTMVNVSSHPLGKSLPLTFPPALSTRVKAVTLFGRPNKTNV